MKTVAAFGLLIAMLIVVEVRARADDQDSTPVPQSAADFLNHNGISSHVVQAETSCAQLQEGVQFLGVRHVRDDFTCDGCDPRNLIANCFIPTHQLTGVTFDVLPSCVAGTTTASLPFLMSVDDQWAQGGALDSIEECNEPNHFAFDYNGMGCGLGGASFDGCAAFAQDFYAAVKADPILANFPVFAMTEPGAEGDNAGMQFLIKPGNNQTRADYANLHNYLFGPASAAQGQVDNGAWFPFENTGSMGAWDGMDGEFCNQTFFGGFLATPEADCPSIPRVTTETGWPASGQISDDARGKLIINGLASAYARGVTRTYVYQLNDAPDQFGQYDSTFTPRLSAVYWHNMSTILADPVNPNLVVNLIPLTITGTSGTDHWFQLEKGDGSQWLVVWADRPASDNLSENWSAGATPTAVFDPTVGTGSTGTTLPPLTDHMLIVEF